MAYLSPKLTGTSPEVFYLETSDTQGYAMDWHAHDGAMLLLPREGSLFLSTESTQVTHVSNHAFSFVPAEFAHATQAAPGRERHLTLYIDPAYVSHRTKACGTCPIGKQLARSGTWQASEGLGSILRLHDELQRSTEPQAFQRQLPHLNHLLFNECARLMATADPTQPPPNPRHAPAALVRDIQRYVRENLDTDLSLDAVGHQFHLSRRHLSRLFKAHTGQPLLDFINRTRVDTAARLLAGTSLSVLEVSLAVGLESPSYLARLFQRHLGVSPSQLRLRR